MATATVNNITYDFASIQFVVGKLVYTGFEDISYKHGVKVEKFWGSSRVPVGRTEGVYECSDVKVSMRKADAVALRAALGKGYMRESSAISGSVAYGNKDAPTVTDRLVGLRLIDEGDDHKKGPSPVMETLMFSCMMCLKNNVDPMNF